ncbi:Uncharacterised protein (plasmid) [Tsukamurella tyrosinosolvens]|uniref:Uncharacterized protein n=1 Tax=Tsukamurella tyrosinosolvens TaxID=57704 RepID=A0A1H4UWJ5_TSUTY|nr:hypothetical protein [Tsukamurella tyrosinosolvens]KXO98392.1 hypothetical protein AXK58_25300 [Tsukamurella tyrosinosolvens]SEC72514.1 hypothetical protein SAMN04489793_3047 [Tsukamurella tyrosinosolvens]VEH90867.1 Uncharacterised protein [Tsukamurella tyrosinosolvens]
MSIEVQELNADSTGKWLVTTQGSTHIWDLDAGQYTRNPGSTGSGASQGDGDAHAIVAIHAWPRVGESFHIVHDGGPFEDRWRISSTIRKIERLEE